MPELPEVENIRRGVKKFLLEPAHTANTARNSWIIYTA